MAAFAPVLPTDVEAQQWLNRWAWRASYGLIGGLSCFVGLMALRDVPAPFALCLTVVLLGLLAVLARPVIGLHLCLGLSLVGDANLAPWYPFTKNASSMESIFFVHPAIILSPLDLFLVATTASWLLSRLAVERRPFEPGRLLAPLSAFTGFVVVGLFHGLGTGGDRTVALWEVRPLLYLPILYVLASNLLVRRAQVRWLAWSLVAGVSVEGLYGLALLTVAPGHLAELGASSLVEHSSAMHTNVLFVLALAVWLFPQASSRMRAVLPLLSGLVLAPYLVAERRAAVVGLVVAVLLMAVVLFRQRRRAFSVIVPTLAIVACGYVAVFWNATGAAGFPAQAVKSVIAPDQLSAEDQASGVYRQVETYNLVETIKAHPLVGQGLGHKFLRPISLPDISFFVWWEYIPHNSILWVWSQLGIGGFLAMLYLFGTAIGLGARTTVALGAGEDAALTLTATLTLVMFLVYAYVDMAWDAQSMLLVGAAFAVIGNVERLSASDPAPLSAARGAATDVPVPA